MMNIIDFVKEFDFIKGVRGWGKKLRGARRAPLKSPGGCGQTAAPPLKPPMISATPKILSAKSNLKFLSLV